MSLDDKEGSGTSRNQYEERTARRGQLLLLSAAPFGFCRVGRWMQVRLKTTPGEETQPCSKTMRTSARQGNMPIISELLRTNSCAMRIKQLELEALVRRDVVGLDER